MLEPLQRSPPPLFQRWDGWPGSHRKHNEREDLAGQSGILMIHMFISYLPTSILPFPHTLSTPFLSAPLIKRMCGEVEEVREMITLGN